ncbi:MAG: SDR family oxidoreductase [Thiotrichales bacterium]|nr:SDR family oxidoreductase [Thiotrichales bacterium]
MSDTNKHAVVTGGGSGIGLAIAKRLAKADYAVTILGRNEAKLETALANIPGGRAAVCDVADEESVTDAFGKIGPAAVLINNAGVVSTAPFLKTDTDTWRHTLDINLMGAVHCTQAVLPGMKDLGFGRIINVASTASLKGYAYVSAYVASKHAVLGLTRSLALELAKTGITINAVCPGYTRTDIMENSIATVADKTGRSAEEAEAEFTKANPQGRLIEPEEVAAAVLWLASNEATSITGQAIAIAGGEVM